MTAPKFLPNPKHREMTLSEIAFFEAGHHDVPLDDRREEEHIDQLARAGTPKRRAVSSK